MSELLDAALNYAARGWQVFALTPRQKIPRKNTRGFLDATTDEKTICEMWAQEPNANIGIATGERSNLFVIDIDPRHGGSDTFLELQKENGPIPQTIIVGTGGGGFQFYFQHVPGLASGAGRIGQGIDHRGEGGYVVAPPSIHPSGDSYIFHSDYSPSDINAAELPQWVINLITTPSIAGTFKTVPADFYRELFAKGAKAGERNDALIRMAGHLIRKRLDPFLVLDILRLWNDHRFIPPGDHDKLEAIVDRVAARELVRVSKIRGKT